MPEIKPISLRLPADLKPLFANLVRAAHTPGEFILDFSAVLPGQEFSQVDARVILSPFGRQAVAAGSEREYPPLREQLWRNPASQPAAYPGG
jgi:Protein of unknown function (DUF3467).